MNTCPCCGRELRAPAAIGKVLNLSRLERRVFDRLSRSFGAWVTPEALIEASYWDEPDGGPDAAHKAVSSTLKGLRRKLRAVGMEIEWQSGQGNGSRRLIWQPSDGVSPTINTSSRRSRPGMHNLVNEALTVSVNNSRTN